MAIRDYLTSGQYPYSMEGPGVLSQALSRLTAMGIQAYGMGQQKRSDEEAGLANLLAMQKKREQELGDIDAERKFKTAERLGAEKAALNKPLPPDKDHSFDMWKLAYGENMDMTGKFIALASKIQSGATVQEIKSFYNDPEDAIFLKVALAGRNIVSAADRRDVLSNIRKILSDLEQEGEHLKRMPIASSYFPPKQKEVKSQIDINLEKMISTELLKPE